MTTPQLAITLAAIAAVVAVWWPIRAAQAPGMEQAFEAPHVRVAAGVIVGADPYGLRGPRDGACC